MTTGLHKNNYVNHFAFRQITPKNYENTLKRPNNDNRFT